MLLIILMLLIEYLYSKRDSVCQHCPQVILISQKGETKIRKKLINLEYKAELSKKQPKKYVYKLYMLASILLVALIFVILYQSKDRTDYAELVYMFCTLGTFIAYPLFIRGLIDCPYSLTKERRVRLKLLQIIEEHKFYNENAEGNQINSSMIIKFNLYSNGLVLKVFPKGAKYTSKMDDLTRIFETKFAMTVVSVENNSPDFTTYTLEDTSNNSIDASKIFGKWDE